MSYYHEVQSLLKANPRRWLITGVAGFIGSNLLEALLKLGQTVKGIDNFSTGYARNLDEVKRRVSKEHWRNFHFEASDIRDLRSCDSACSHVDFVLHQAALGSVPRSIEEPCVSHDSNVTGFLNMLEAVRKNGVKRLVYASSSAVYGDHQDSPKVEARTGKALSPYAATKMANEKYSEAFAAVYGTEVIGLRYFNVFGPRQDPSGAYAAVIPKWILLCAENKPCVVNGSPEITRDFCYVDNVVQANILAALAEREATNSVYNVGCGETITLARLHHLISSNVSSLYKSEVHSEPIIGEARAGDIAHSLADISRTQKILGFRPIIPVAEGLKITIEAVFNNPAKKEPKLQVISDKSHGQSEQDKKIAAGR
jgi:UDP-N-acetylglucosamine 4-epimerase